MADDRWRLSVVRSPVDIVPGPDIRQIRQIREIRGIRGIRGNSLEPEPRTALSHRSIGSRTSKSPSLDAGSTPSR